LGANLRCRGYDHEQTLRPRLHRARRTRRCRVLPRRRRQCRRAADAPPSYATPSNEEQITGSITAVPGKYALQVRDTRGFIDNVTLHPGTIINPTGLKLAAGMQVSITGVNAGQTFTANQIDAPYAIALVARPDSTIGIGFAPSWGWGPRYRGGFWW
jgi:hypothetical protein